MLAIVHSGQAIFGAGLTDPYLLLQGVEPGLMVDVGAAAGMTTTAMLRYSPGSHVLAFEPFAGNWPYFEKAVGTDLRVVLRREALGDAPGTRRFFVRSTVQGTEPGWEHMSGYSSLGYLVDDMSPLAAQASEVAVARLDDEVQERVRFLKIDVQGGELGVLRGAEKLLAGGAIDMVYVEFRGEVEVLELLHHNGFIIFDGAFMVLPRGGRRAALLRPFLSPGRVGRETACEYQLSTGQRAKQEWLDIPRRNFAPYCDWIRATRLAVNIETDLLCVHERYCAAFLSALGQVHRMSA